MAEKKTIIETCAYPTRGDLNNARQNVETGLRLAMELQDAGVRLTPQVLEVLALRSEYDPSCFRDEIRIQVPAEHVAREHVESWQTLSGARAVRVPDGLPLEQLNKLRSEVDKRIEEAEGRLLDDVTPDPAAPKVDIVTAKSARVRAASASPAHVIEAANLARKTLLLARNDAGLPPTDADAEISLAVAAGPRRIIVTARPPALEPF